MFLTIRDIITMCHSIPPNLIWWLQNIPFKCESDAGWRRQEHKSRAAVQDIAEMNMCSLNYLLTITHILPLGLAASSSCDYFPISDAVTSNSNSLRTLVKRIFAPFLSGWHNVNGKCEIIQCWWMADVRHPLHRWFRVREQEPLSLGGKLPTESS